MQLNEDLGTSLIHTLRGTICRVVAPISRVDGGRMAASPVAKT
jgi:hypothetical protein